MKEYKFSIFLLLFQLLESLHRVQYFLKILRYVLIDVFNIKQLLMNKKSVFADADLLTLCEKAKDRIAVKQ